ncbi:uncharacterized protein LOC6639643 isoform X6 [Drosophila willistoni]|uniref:uncharacterized protein LOC6639643 isoform X6 n=1 Tax=Drosophila willistoni TaxID=7260 RepID=UPI001F07C3ED|nr:uncharacterized protein LOC6639643 isoform X6 [Drosophila willistoni]
MEIHLRMQRNSCKLFALIFLLLNLNNHMAYGRPDVRQSPFALELQPPLVDTPDQTADFNERAVDSYGNPIDSLHPIDTPDGRKVVSAQGLQFEIPTYASGITEIRKPADDLLPPHIAPDKKPEDADLTNPFDSATIPTWLRDFDYPDVGPGVPFNPDNFKDPPAGQGIGVGVSGGSKPNDFKPQGFTASTGTSANIPVTSKITTSTPKPFPIPTTLAVSSAFPSKVTLTLPELNQQQGPGDEDTNTVEPPSVLIPPLSQPLADETVSSSLPVDYNPSTNSIINFAARFDTAVSHQPTEPPRPATDESFPPFNTGNADTNHKVEYTKSDEGKVISTPVISNQRKETPAPAPAAQPAVNPGKYTGGFGAPAGLLRPQVASKPDIYVAGDQHEFSNNVKGTKARPTSNPGRYNGGFGAPSGVLSPHSSEPPRPFQPQQRQHQPELVSAASSHSTTSRFGGPPGILVPFDNVQRSEGQ